MKKISAALWDIARPFIDSLPENASDRARRHAVEMGVLVWNGLALLRRGDSRMWDGFTDYCRSLPKNEFTSMALIVDESVRRKNARHADDIRIVKNWKLTIHDDGTALLRAQASAPAERAATRSKRQDR